MNIFKFLVLFLLISCSKSIHKKVFPYYQFQDEEQIDFFLKREAEKRGIDFNFAKAVLIKESHYKKDVISSTGAVGLMQLMPRYGSYITDNYKNYELAKKNKPKQIFKDKTHKEWISEYKKDLLNLLQDYSSNREGLYKKDKRFDPEWNIKSGVGQLAEEYKHFINRKHTEYKSRILSAAAYNAGKYSVMNDESKPKFDSIPINNQTEYYAISVEKIYQALKKGNGRLLKENIYLLYQ